MENLDQLRGLMEGDKFKFREVREYTRYKKFILESKKYSFEAVAKRLLDLR